jgi:hypothetical protein
MTVRRNQRGGNRFSGFGYYTTKDPTDSNQYFGQPFYVVFGH